MLAVSAVQPKKNEKICVQFRLQWRLGILGVAQSLREASERRVFRGNEGPNLNFMGHLFSLLYREKTAEERDGEKIWLYQ